jgi:hypothetical protein
MATLFADGVEINIEDGHWRIYNLEGANSLSPFFDVLRGTGLINYVTSFGDSRRLPGNVLATDYVKAVVVGFDERHNYWTLGLHIQDKPADKPRFVELVHWPAGESEKYGAESHQAGRILAEYTSCPLKLFGVKKAPVATPDKRSTMTGPLVPHRRSDIDVQRVRIKAETVKLPISMAGVWVGGARNNITLRVSRDADQAKNGIESPAYNQVVIDRESQTVRLLPPTGLLGVFLGPQGRTLKFQEVRNVELRQATTHESSIQKDEDGMAVDTTLTHHLYGVYLTIANESLLLIQMQHVRASELTRHRAKVGLSAVSKGSMYDAEQEMGYLRQHQADQNQQDAIQAFAESAAYVIATGLGRPLVLTETEDV